MALIKEQYSVNAIDRIFQLLQNEADKGTPKEYDIKVDALKVVGRNNDVERFFDHETFLTANSRHITINIYDGSSPRCTRYMLLLSEEEPGKKELSGIGKTIGARIQQERKVWEYDRQKQEIAHLRQALEDKERQASDLQQRIGEMNAERQKLPGRITETLLSLAGVYITGNPKTLAGTQQNGQSNPSATNTEETGQAGDNENTEKASASYKEAKEPEYTGKATEDDFERFEKALIPLFPEQYREQVATTVSIMYHNHHIIQPITDLLTEEARKNQAQQQQAA